MKKLMITLLLTGFCWTAFAMEMPRQDTTRRQQDTTKRHPAKSKVGKKKSPGKKGEKRPDTSSRRKPDTTRTTPPM